jgi:hypothetical protein
LDVKVLTCTDAALFGIDSRPDDQHYDEFYPSTVHFNAADEGAARSLAPIRGRSGF